jgi:hypothetical protein
MKSPSFIYTLLLLLLLGLASGCATFTGFSTGRTVGKGNGEVRGSLSIIETPDLIVSETDTLIPTLRIPLLEGLVRIGVTERLDIGLKISSVAIIALDGKYQFIGNQESIFAAAVGAEIGLIPLPLLIGVPVTVVYFHVPLYLSIHPTEKIHIYVSPRYVYQYGTSISKFIGNANYTGFHAGVLFGREFKFGFDFSNYRVHGDGGIVARDYDKPNLFNLGLGMSYSF